MNYTTLFPKLLQRLPNIQEKDLCYNYQKSNNYNKNNLNVYLPQGKKLLLWFLKYDNNHYSILVEINEKNKNIEKCYFQYSCFKEELTSGCGTILWCTKIDHEISLNKILYYMGKQYTKKYVLEHINDMKYMLTHSIKNIKSPSFVQFKLPIVSSNKNYIFQASSLNYTVYSIITQNNYNIPLHGFIANFQVHVEDHLKDMYTLYILNNQNELEFYQYAFINDFKTSSFMKNIFRIKHKNYKEIEFEDVKQSDDDVTECEKHMILSCLYIPDMKKWKPYKVSYKKYIDLIKKIKFIENKKY